MATYLMSDQGGGDCDNGGGDDAPARTGSILVTPQDDVLVGTSGGDLVFGFAGTDYIIADAGVDVIRAGAGDAAEAEADRDVTFADDGDDNVFGDDDGVFGGLSDDLFIGPDGDDDDTYYGDAISGDADNDTTTMPNAVNIVDGDDIFLFGSTAAAHGDTIRSFEAGDKIDLSRIDANTGSADNNRFTLENDQSATAPGQIVITHEAREDGEYVVTSGSTSGDNAPEFGVSIPGNHNVGGSDFQL